MSTDVSVFDRQKAAAFGLVLKVLQSVFGAEPVLDRSMRCAKIPSRKLLPFLGWEATRLLPALWTSF